MSSFAHTAFDTAFGPVALAATGTGVMRCSLPGSDPDELVEEVIQLTGMAPVEDGAAADEPADQVIRFLAGETRGFDLDVDWRLTSGFTRKALAAAREIPYGETAGYGDVAIMAGSPGAARAVGTAMSRNPIALIVPCHRVIRSDGSIGGYGGGANSVQLKQRLLDLERSDR